MFSREGENVVRQLTLPKHGLTEEQVMEQLKMYVGILLTCEVVCDVRILNSLSR